MNIGCINTQTFNCICFSEINCCKYQNLCFIGDIDGSKSIVSFEEI